MELLNGYLRPFQQHLGVVGPNRQSLDDMARRRGVFINTDKDVRSYFDWSRMPQFRTEENADNYRDFAIWLQSSQLWAYDVLIMAFDWRDPVLAVPVRLFIENWETFERAGHSETVGLTDDGKCVIEFQWLSPLLTSFPWTPAHFASLNGGDRVQTAPIE